VSWKTIFSNAEPRFGAADRPLRLVRHAAARCLRLRVDPRDGSVRLTIPRRASLRDAYRWVEEQRPWIEAELARHPPRRRFRPGLSVPVAGASVMLVHDPAARAVRRRGDTLVVGGPAETFEARVLRWLKAEARRLLDAETRALAAANGLAVRRVGIGDPRSRWGSCSAAGDIRYSWRLILAPDFVRRGTVAHEVAHLMHMNHGAGFRALEAALLGSDPLAGRDWLRRQGAELHRWGPIAGA